MALSKKQQKIREMIKHNHAYDAEEAIKFLKEVASKKI